MLLPEAFYALVNSFRKLPGVGQKTAERYAFALLELPAADQQDFMLALKNSRNSLTTCKRCGFLSSKPLCPICADQSRDPSQLCVVSYYKDVIALENMQTYHGYYHVLNGVISTSKGLLPEDLNLASLPARLAEVKELIIATSFTIEGETTALYLSKLLAPYPHLKLTRLAHGLPMGSQLEYVDEMTLMKALENRKNITADKEPE